MEVNKSKQFPDTVNANISGIVDTNVINTINTNTGFKDILGAEKSGLTLSDGVVQTVQSPFAIRVARGEVPNYKLIQIAKFFVNSGISEQLFSTGYIEQSSEAQRSLVSTSASDGISGVGARRIKIEFLKNDNTEGAEEIILNGITPVNTVSTDIRHINKMVVSEVGSNGVSVGQINLKTGINGTGSNICSIFASGTREQTAHFYVPALKTLFVDKFLFSSNDNGQVRIKISERFPSGNIVFHTVFDCDVSNPSPIFLDGFIAPIPEGGKFEIFVLPTASGKRYYCLIRAFLINN